MRAVVATLTALACVASRPPPTLVSAAPTATCPAPERPSPHRDAARTPPRGDRCVCAMLCPPCGGARIRPELEGRLREARGDCPDWHELCRCPSCRDDERGDEAPQRPAGVVRPASSAAPVEAR